MRDYEQDTGCPYLNPSKTKKRENFADTKDFEFKAFEFSGT